MLTIVRFRLPEGVSAKDVENQEFILNSAVEHMISRGYYPEGYGMPRILGVYKEDDEYVVEYKRFSSCD